MSSIPAGVFRALYRTLLGAHPRFRPWQFQWLPGRILYPTLRPVLAELEGDVLDVGCGDKPYESWVPRAERYVGIDVTPGPKVNIVIRPGEPWPLPDDSFDVVLCTQVLEHVADLGAMVAQLARVLRPGGRLVASFPFIYGEHGAPHDYWRFSRHGAERLLVRHFDVEHVLATGGVGSSAGTLVQNWLQTAITRTVGGRTALVALFPLWLGITLSVNLFGAALDRLDRTGTCYGNVLVLATARVKA